MTAVAGDWSDAGGALLLFLTNVLAIIVVGVAVFGAVTVRSDRLAGPVMRPAYAVVAIVAALVVGALCITTYHAVQVSDWQQNATTVGTTWAGDHGEQFVSARFDGSTLVMVVQGDSNGAQDGLLPGLLRGKVPAGTPVVVDRIAGSEQTIGKVDP